MSNIATVNPAVIVNYVGSDEDGYVCDIEWEHFLSLGHDDEGAVTVSRSHYGNDTHKVARIVAIALDVDVVVKD